MEQKKYNNMVGLILYSGNPFAIKKMHDIIDFAQGDNLRKEIILTKYIVSTMTETQRNVFKRIAAGEFKIQRSTYSSSPSALDYKTQIEYYHDLHNIMRREVRVPNNSELQAWFAIDEERNVAFKCNLVSIEVTKDRYLPGESLVSPIKFSTDLGISKLFYYLCCSIDYKNNECNKIEEVQAAYEFQDQIANLYKD